MAEEFLVRFIFNSFFCPETDNVPFALEAFLLGID